MKTLLRALYLVYYCLVAAPLFVVATILLSTITVVGCALGGQRLFGYWPGVYWSRIALVLSLCPTRVVGREYIPKDHKPCVVMANHQGAFDIFMMDSARRVLSEGTSIFIFPEGRRTLTGRMDRFKKGGFVLAYELDVPIIPVSIDGSYRALRAGGRWVTPTRLTLTIHPPIQIDREGEFPRNMLQALDQVRSSIASVLPEEQETHS